MLRRRILASAMASVMAIGSVAVVASADETAAAVKNVKTKADLEAYVKSFDSFRENELYDYGSISGENFLSALEYADNVLADAESNADDYTSAYAMIEAVRNKLVIYTAEQLSTLIDKCKKAYESDNIYNDELGDAIYDADTFDTFEGAYEEAESVLDSADSRLITDAYEKLDAAYNGLKKLDTVSKAQFRAALKDYETALKKEFAYDAWRVGTIQGSNSADFGYGFWAYDGQTVAYGTLYEHVVSLKKDISDAYAELDEIKALSVTSQVNLVDAYMACKKATAVLNGFKADDTNKATKANVKSLLNQYHGRLVHDYATSTAVDLYNAVIDAVVTTAGGKVEVRQEVNAYSNDMFDSAVVADPWYTTGADFTADPNGGAWKATTYKLISAEISVKADTAYYIPLNALGYWDGGAIETTKPTGSKKYKTVSKKATIDLTEYINVTAAEVALWQTESATDNHLINNVLDGDAPFTKVNAADHNWAGEWFNGAAIGWGNTAIGSYGAIAGATQSMDGHYTNSSDETVATYADLLTAMELADIYLSGDKAIINGNALIEDVDTIDAISTGTAKGSSAEWNLVYRYLKYALADKYDASYGTHTKAEVVDLIDKCYELADLTGDAALFSYNHNALVAARQKAIDWVKAANKIKTYKDNVTPAAYGTGSEVATKVYDDLKGAYDKLENDYNAFKYSFGEIYDYIAKVSDMIDSGDIDGNEAVTTALENTAYYLSVVKSLDDDLSGSQSLDNDAFTSDRYFQSFNRCYTKGDNEYELATEPSGDKIKVLKSSASAASKSHADLAKAYEALMAAVKAQTEVTYAVGDVNHDGKVDIADASLVLKYAFNVLPEGTEFDVALADYDTVGGKGDIADASAILKAAFKV